MMPSPSTPKVDTMTKITPLLLLLPILAQADMRGPSDEAKQRADERLAAREQQLGADLANALAEFREHLRQMTEGLSND